MTQDQRVQQLRGIGWAHCLDLIARGMEEDAAMCEGESWPETAACLYDWSEQVGHNATAYRRGIAAAEQRDKV